jgi:hypothetical protein
MGLHQIDVQVTLTEINCGECGGTYALTEQYRHQRERDGGGWHCPYCQVGYGYANNNENARLKKELEAEKKRKEWAQQEATNQRIAKEEWQRKEQGQRAAKTRIKNRVSKGVCPCCNRTFQDLGRHMAGQHPDYGNPEPAA